MIIAGFTYSRSARAAAVSGAVAVVGILQLFAYLGSGKTKVVARRVVIHRASANAGCVGYTPANIVAFAFADKAEAQGPAKGFGGISALDASWWELIARVNRSTLGKGNSTTPMT